jgi:hypothetical protein
MYTENRKGARISVYANQDFSCTLQGMEAKRPRGRPKRAGGAREPHTHRFDPGTYTTAATIAEKRGETVGDVLARALDAYVRRHRAELSDDLDG